MLTEPVCRKRIVQTALFRKEICFRYLSISKIQTATEFFTFECWSNVSIETFTKPLTKILPDLPPRQVVRQPTSHRSIPFGGDEVGLRNFG